ncbi:MAG TPA: PGPGW domain-containing protein [Nocardioidaceae bacterium]|nr:PGPGW domain-containing protein [Nocardioidaceae bacterium]
MTTSWYSRLDKRLHAHPALAWLTKIVVSLVGFAVLILGFITIVTPGPAVVLIPLGLAILATEFAWARRALVKAREYAARAKAKAEQMDPRVRRRRILLAVVGVLAVVAAIVAYVWVYDWPGWAVSAWNWAQGRAGWLPDLPKM